MFDAIGRHALGELIEVSETVTYNTVSRKTGSFNSTGFKTRDEYSNPDIPSDAILWDDDTPMLWDDDTYIEWD